MIRKNPTWKYYKNKEKDSFRLILKMEKNLATFIDAFMMTSDDEEAEELLRDIKYRAEYIAREKKQLDRIKSIRKTIPKYVHY